MEVFKKTLSTVFTGERRYVIPLFQRPYVWTRENQWEPLWDDIVDRAEVDLEQPELDAPPHFMGAMVIQQRPSWGDQLLTHDVIDGQQRLTTFQILLAAFRDIAGERDEKQVTASLVSWTRNSNPIADPDIEQFKLWPTGRDVEQYRLVVTAGARSAIEAVHPPIHKRRRLQPRPRMVEAYLFFNDKINEWLGPAGPQSVSDRSKALRRVFDKRIQLVSIELEKQEDPQAIFETLNARGVPLLASDLLRNYIFQRAGSPTEANRLHAKYWARFEVPDDPNVPDGARFWEAEERQGRLSRARLDLFVHHYLAMKCGNDVVSGRLFPEYKAWIERHKPFAGSLDDELREFTTFAEHFHQLLRPSPTTALGKFAQRLRALDTSTVYPLVLSLLGSGMPAAELHKIFVDLESFLVRRAICQRTSKNYNRLFLQIMRDFALGEQTRSAFHGLLAAGSGEAVDWPDDATFEAAWNTLDAYDELKAGKAEMILRALEGALLTGTTENITIHGKLTVEHVLPQAWQKHWPLPGADAESAAEARDDLVHDFGNLTLLTQPLNSAVSNGPADQKLPKIALDSALRLNKHFQNRTTWTEADITARGAELFEVAKSVWPRR